MTTPATSTHKVARTPAELAADTVAALVRHGPMTVSQLCQACACDARKALPKKYVLALMDKGLAHVHDRPTRQSTRYAWGPGPGAVSDEGAGQSTPVHDQADSATLLAELQRLRAAIDAVVHETHPASKAIVDLHILSGSWRKAPRAG
jgi:hypothetical protein